MFNNLIVAYLFLGGMGAGACCVLCVLSVASLNCESEDGRLRVRSRIANQRFFGFGFLIASALCALGACCLLADMKRPDEVLVLLTSPTLSVVSVGAYTLAATILLGILTGLAWLRAFSVASAVLRVLAAVHVALSCAVMTYTALLLMAFSGVPFFQSPLLIPLFMASSLSCGTAMVSLIAVVTRTADSFAGRMRRLVRADTVLLVFEMLVLIAFALMSVRYAPESAGRLLGGELSAVFWMGLVVAGMGAPLVLYAVGRIAPSSRIHPLLPASLVLVGGFVLRWCILAAA